MFRGIPDALRDQDETKVSRGIVHLWLHVMIIFLYVEKYFSGLKSRYANNKNVLDRKTQQTKMLLKKVASFSFSVFLVQVDG